MKHYSEDELLRLACIHAESDRASYLDAWRGVDDAKGKKEQADTRAFIEQLRAYRIKRWGRTALETELGELRSVDVLSLSQIGDGPKGRKRKCK